MFMNKTTFTRPTECAQLWEKLAAGIPIFRPDLLEKLPRFKAAISEKNMSSKS